MPASSPGETLSVVIPVYGGADTLGPLVAELLAVGTPSPTEGTGRLVSEILLVWDGARDRSDEVIRQLAARHPEVRPIWLTRNFGQHAATLAGIASSTGDWVVTMDEDGLHDPASIPALLATAHDGRADVVYGHPTEGTGQPGRFRSSSSRASKAIARRLLSNDGLADYSSFRLIRGDIARALSAYAGSGTYLDVAISWLTTRCATCAVPFRPTSRASTYSVSSLLSHFRRLVVTSGVRPLRLVSALGVLSATLGVALAAYVIVRRLTTEIEIEGWSSVMVAVLLLGGAVLLALGIIAEYLAIVVQTSLGRPLFLISRDPTLYHDAGPPVPETDDRSR